MLAYLINDLLEVPFLTQHRLDELEHAQYDETGRSRETTTLLVRQELLTLSTLGVKYKLLLARKDALRAVFAQLEALDTPDVHHARATVDELVAQAGSFEEVSDVGEWLAMRFGERFREATALAKGADAPTLKRPTVVSEYDQRKGTVVAQLVTRLGLSLIHI